MKMVDETCNWYKWVPVNSINSLLLSNKRSEVQSIVNTWYSILKFLNYVIYKDKAHIKKFIPYIK